MELDFLSSIIKGDNNPPNENHACFKMGKMSLDKTIIVIVE